jgi:hypothetical protein
MISLGQPFITWPIRGGVPAGRCGGLASLFEISEHVLVLQLQRLDNSQHPLDESTARHLAEIKYENGAGTIVDLAYGYDRNSQRVYKEDKLETTKSEVFSYDNSGQVSGWAKGTLNSTKDGITGTPTATQGWDYDAIGNWSEVTTDGVGESRDHNAQNQITTVGSTGLLYDDNGNLTQDESGKKYIYDAWNRLVEVQNSSSATLVDCNL